MIIDFYVAFTVNLIVASIKARRFDHMPHQFNFRAVNRLNKGYGVFCPLLFATTLMNGVILINIKLTTETGIGLFIAKAIGFDRAEFRGQPLQFLPPGLFRESFEKVVGIHGHDLVDITVF